MVALRIASWNLKGRSGGAAGRLGSLLAECGGADLVLLQEASRRGLDEFREAAGLDWAVHVRDVCGDLLWVRRRWGYVDQRGYRVGEPRSVAIAGRGAPLRGPTTFPDIWYPEKVMAGWLDLGGHRTSVVTYHAPAGATHGIDKPKQAVRVAEWLASLDGPVLMGGDFNTPSADPVDDRLVRTHWHTGEANLGGLPGDDLLVGPEPVHPLRDALRTHLAADPGQVAAIGRERPDGPLELSYRTGDRDEHRYRFDAIWLSPHFQVRSVEYHYEAAIEAGTDHALVLADVELADSE